MFHFYCPAAPNTAILKTSFSPTEMQTFEIVAHEWPYGRSGKINLTNALETTPFTSNSTGTAAGNDSAPLVSLSSICTVIPIAGWAKIGVRWHERYSHGSHITGAAP